MALPHDFRAQSRKRWGSQAKGWEARRDLLRASTMPVSAWMIDAVDPQPGHNLLELAAGTGDTGLLAAELAAPSGTLICSDFAPEMLDGAQRRAEELGVTNVRFKQIDAESIDIAAASLDGVFCRWGYMLMADPRAALRETRRVLKPGARVALAAWSGPETNAWSVLPIRELNRHAGDPVPDPALPNQFSWADAEVISEHLDAAGFSEHDVEPLDFTMNYSSAQDWWAAQADLSSRAGELLSRLSSDQVAQACTAVMAHARDFEQPDGSLRIPARTWVAWAAT